MRLSRLLGAATAALVVASPLAATATPAAAAASTRLILHTSAHRATYLQKVTIRGRVTSGGVPVDGVTVTLAKRPLGSRTWRVVGHDVTAGGNVGAYAFTTAATRNAVWRVAFAGNPTYAASASRTTVWVHRKVTGKVVQPRSDVFFLTGRVTPRYGGRRVALLRKTCSTCAYRTYSRQRTRATGKYRLRLPIPRKGSDFFKVRVRGNRSFLRSDSPTWSLTRLG